MHVLSLFASLVLPLVIATPLTSAPAQLLNLNPLTFAPLNISSINLGVEIGCFKQTEVRPLITTNKTSCEAALDSWVRGQSLLLARTFSRNPSAILTSDDVLLPLQRVSGSCMIYLNMLNEDDEVTLTLAEVYAEVLGPDGVMKQCLGQVRSPAIGGRMALGDKGLLKVVVTGVESRGVGDEE